MYVKVSYPASIRGSSELNLLGAELDYGGEFCNKVCDEMMEYAASTPPDEVLGAGQEVIHNGGGLEGVGVYGDVPAPALLLL